MNDSIWLPSFGMNSPTFGEGTLESERLFNETLQLLGLAPWNEHPAFHLHYVAPSAFFIRLDAPNVAPFFFDFDEGFQIEMPGGAPIEIGRSDYHGEHGVIYSVVQVLTARISVRYSRFSRVSKCTISYLGHKRKPSVSTSWEGLWSNWPSGVRGTTTTYEPFAITPLSGS